MKLFDKITPSMWTQKSYSSDSTIRNAACGRKNTIVFEKRDCEKLKSTITIIIDQFEMNGLKF